MLVAAGLRETMHAVGWWRRGTGWLVAAGLLDRLVRIAWIVLGIGGAVGVCGQFLPIAVGRVSAAACGEAGIEVKVLREKDAAVRRHPEVTPLFPLLEARFPLVVNAVGSSLLPSTNNATERVIKAFHRHYRDMAGLESLETAEIQAKLFRFWYRLTPMRDAVDKNDRNKCPLEKADFDLDGVPIIEYVRQVLCTAKRVAPASQRAAALDERRTTDPGRLAAVG